MKPPPFAYVQPTSVSEAVERLRSDDGSAPLAGGQSLVPLLNLRLARPTTVVDLTRIPGLGEIEIGDGHVSLGALTTHSAIEHHEWAVGLAALPAGVSRIGYRAVRHRGTLGGSLAHADPAAELPTLAVAFDARVELRSPDGARSVAAEDFFLGYYETARSRDELVTALTIPTPDDLRSGFAEFSRRPGDFAVALAAVATWTRDGVRHGRVVVGGLDVRPRRIPEAEEAMASGDPGWADAVDVDLLGAHTSPSVDIHGTAEHRLTLGVEMIRRAGAHMESTR